jgi:hypothetical protein
MTDADAPTERLAVSRTIKAEPAAIFAIVSDPQGQVDIDASGMLMDATGEPATAVGDTFVVHMNREALNDYPMGDYDVTIQITTFEPDREIAWTLIGDNGPLIGHIYGYTLEPVEAGGEGEGEGEGGTVVTSYYDWSAIGPDWKARGIFPVIPESALRATLGILDRTVARSSTRR